MACLRLNDSFLAKAERELLARLVRRLPERATPDHLTAVGLAGAFLAALGFVTCNWSNAGLALVIAGLFLNWFGDSLDGTLARHRRIERPHYGYFIDHSVDLIAQTLIIVGLGLSPFFTIHSALLVLSLYLLMSSYTYLRVVTESVHRLSYAGMGATEFRILVGAWALFAAAWGPGLVTFELCSFAALDLAIGLMSAGRIHRHRPRRPAPHAARGPGARVARSGGRPARRGRFGRRAVKNSRPNTDFCAAPQKRRSHCAATVCRIVQSGLGCRHSAI